MFDFLKKKISSWIGKEKPKKQKKKESKKEKAGAKKVKKKEIAKKTKTDKPLKEIEENMIVLDSKQESRLLTKDEKETKEEVEEILEDAVKIPEKEIEEEKEEKGNFFTKLFKKITTSKLSQEDFDEIFQEFEITLLENNVALEAA